MSSPSSSTITTRSTDVCRSTCSGQASTRRSVHGGLLALQCRPVQSGRSEGVNSPDGHLAQGGAFAATADEHAPRVRVHDHRRVNQHLVIDEFLGLRALRDAIEVENCAKVIERIDDRKRLKLGLVPAEVAPNLRMFACASRSGAWFRALVHTCALRLVPARTICAGALARVRGSGRTRALRRRILYRHVTF
jgi:hypothetical protein